MLLQASMDPAFEFASTGEHEKFIEFIDKHSKSEREEIINHKYEGVSIFIAACIGGSIEIVAFIVDNFKVDINKRSDICIDGCLISNVSPLWCASYYGHLDIVKYLTLKGADLEIVSDNYVSPLKYLNLFNNFSWFTFIYFFSELLASTAILK